ncbi:2Fe-2S iron-sulfur cluster-binding protein [Nonomuraea sp. NPDC049649]|uniref:2Fe-2S iron-sulfur cluster-binding protein n=1 Tax=Nonomuraea sp. NPDC049649 TaxID=3155776 RepID=UPI00341A9EF6
MLAALERSVPACRLHTERFTPRPRDPAAPFTVELRESGENLHVPADHSLLEVVRRARPDLDSSCEQGVCGDCALRVVGGTPEHRDEVLTDRTRTDIIYPCVSRSATPHLVLDL